MEQSVKLTETGMCSIQKVGDSTSMITLSNEQMTRQIMEMDKTVEDIRIHSSEVASSMEQVNVNTQSNYQAIEHVTAATQENSAGAQAIEDMVVRIRTLLWNRKGKMHEMLVNVKHIISVRTALNGRLYARMENGEEILITRRYAKEVEDCFI